MTIQYTRDKEGVIKSVFDTAGVALNELACVRKAMFVSADLRGQYLKDPYSIHNDLEIMEQHIQSQIGALEQEIILYRRLVHDIQEELK